MPMKIKSPICCQCAPKLDLSLKHGKKGLLVLAFGDCGDTPLAMYELDRAAGDGPPFHSYTFVLETRESSKVVSQARLMMQAYTDYNERKLKISGHAPLPLVPADIATVKDVPAVLKELQERFRRVIVRPSEDGKSAMAHLPPIEDLPIFMEDRAAMEKYETLRKSLCIRFGEMAKVVPAPTKESVPPARADEYLSLEACQKDFDIITSVAAINYNIHAAIPKGMDPLAHPDEVELYLENHNQKNRTEIMKGDIVCSLGVGHFHRLEEGQPARFPYKLMSLAPRPGTREEVKTTPEKDAQVLLANTTGRELVSVDAMLAKHNLMSGGKIWGTERLVTKRGPRVLSFLPAHFVPEPVNMADHSLESVGQLLKFPCADFQLIYVMHLQDAHFEPKNGTNAAAWVTRKKIVLPCGRVVRMK